MQSVSLAELIAARIAAKREEDAAVTARRDIDKQLAELLRDANKPEGTISQKVDGYKVSVVYKIDRKADSDALSKAWDKLPIDVQNAFKWTAGVFVFALKALDDKAQLSASRFITSKEGSPSITIEAI